MRWGVWSLSLLRGIAPKSRCIKPRQSRGALQKLTCSAVRTLFCTSKQYFKGSLWFIVSFNRFLHNNRITHLVPGTFNHLESMKRL